MKAARLPAAHVCSAQPWVDYREKRGAGGGDTEKWGHAAHRITLVVPALIERLNEPATICVSIAQRERTVLYCIMYCLGPYPASALWRVPCVAHTLFFRGNAPAVRGPCPLLRRVFHSTQPAASVESCLGRQCPRHANLRRTQRAKSIPSSAASRLRWRRLLTRVSSLARIQRTPPELCVSIGITEPVGLVDAARLGTSVGCQRHNIDGSD